MTNNLYSTAEQRLDTVLGDADFWWKMQQCRKLEGAEHCTTDVATMIWFRDTYGIQLLPSDDTIIGFQRQVDIVDEHKYTVFLLKYA